MKIVHEITKSQDEVSKKYDGPSVQVERGGLFVRGREEALLGVATLLLRQRLERRQGGVGVVVRHLMMMGGMVGKITMMRMKKRIT